MQFFQGIKRERESTEWAEDKHFPTFMVHRQCHFVLVEIRVRERLEVKKIKCCEVDLVTNRGQKLSWGFASYEGNSDINV